jgi:hypothetical protein
MKEMSGGEAQMERAFGMFGFVFENLVLFFAFFVLLELVFCYTLQAIADKQNLPFSWMAWVPLLQLYPMVMAGSSSFQPFLALMAAGIAAVILGALLGPLGMLLAVAWSAWALVYFVQLSWNTAEKRGVSGWIGLLAFVPLVNLAAYLYIALHDGPVAPSRPGVMLGFVCFVVPAFPEFLKAREIAQLGQQLGPMAAAAEQGDEAAAQRMMVEMMETMQGMEGVEQQGDPGAMERAMRQLAAAIGRDGESAAGESEPAHPTVIPVPELTPVSPLFECPEGTRERGARPPEGFERWCARQESGRRAVRHGGYASWRRSGQVHVTGLYRDGAREGVWTRWYPNGSKQTQAEFRNGRQDGFQIDWNESGRRLREVRFVAGEPVGR